MCSSHLSSFCPSCSLTFISHWIGGTPGRGKQLDSQRTWWDDVWGHVKVLFDLRIHALDISYWNSILVTSNIFQYTLSARTMMTILSTWAVCHLPLVKSYHLPFTRALPTCSQLRDFLSSCHFCCDSLVSCSVAVGPRTWQTWRCTSCFPPLVALHLGVPLPGLTRTDDSHVLRFFVRFVQKASHWSQWNPYWGWNHQTTKLFQMSVDVTSQLLTVGFFLQLRLVTGQDTGKCTGTVWTKLQQPLLWVPEIQNVRHWLKVNSLESKVAAEQARDISCHFWFFYAFLTSFDIFRHL